MVTKWWIWEKKKKSLDPHWQLAPFAESFYQAVQILFFQDIFALKWYKFGRIYIGIAVKSLYVQLAETLAVW